MNIHPIFSNEDQTVSFAAEELARYLNRMLRGEVRKGGTQDADLEISLDVSADDPAWAEAEGRDSFSVEIRKEKEGGRITGNSPRAVLLGVYDYLHTLGCRFLAPGAQYETVPCVKPEELYVSYRKTASFKHRGVCIEGGNSLENILDFVDWLPKIGCNAFFLQFMVPYTFLARWYQHENNPLLKPEDYSLEDAERDTAKIERAMEQRGLMLHKVGHGWTGETLGFSTVAWKEDDAVLTEKQKSMVAQIGGVRDLYYKVPLNTNLCYSNPEARSAFIAKIADYACQHREVEFLHIWLADANNNICECEECRKTTVSDQYIDILNEVDEILTARGVDTKLVFLLYQELLWPPLKEKLKNPDRFVLMFAPISRTFEASYEIGDTDAQIPPYVRNRIKLPTKLSENLAFLKGWQSLFSGDSFIYDYHLGRAHYGDMGYVHISRIGSEDIKKLHQLGLDGMINCQELRVCMPNALPNYVMGHTLFREDADFSDIVREYYQAAYGEGYEQVLSYLTELSSLCSCDYFNGKSARTDPEMARRMRSVLDLAEAFAPVIEAHRTDGRWQTPFWRILDYHRQYVLSLGQTLYELASGNEKTALDDWNGFCSLIRQKETEFQEVLDVYRVIEVSHNYTGFRNIERKMNA